MKLVVAPGIWLTHFSAVYVLLSLACASEAAQRTLFGFGIVPFGVALATLAALALIAAAAWADRRRLRELRAGPGAFTARVSVLLCALSALAVGWVAYPAFVLPACAS